MGAALRKGAFVSRCGSAGWLEGRRLAAAVVCVAGVLGCGPARAADQPSRQQALDAMKRATTFMVERVSTQGGYVWSYLPDFSRRWGELEARDTMIWIQPPGTATMGHLFLDAYHATGDEYYYRAAQRAAGALIRAQHSSGGWNYLADFGGAPSLREWYDTIGRNAWRLEEFQHDWGNATFDDGGTSESATLLLRLYVEKHDAQYRPALDKAIAFVLDSQYPNGGWPQRYPLKDEFVHHGRPDYTSYLTFNDDVAAGNIEFLTLCYQVLGDQRLLDAIARGMKAFVALQGPAPQAGWALQYTPDLKPAGARTYEPKALVTHTTGRNVELLLQFYRTTGDATFLARIPEALAWLDSCRLPPELAVNGRTHPTFVEVGTNRPLYVHREGSNVVNGRYYADGDPRNTVGHYSSFRRVDVEGLRRQYEAAKALSPAELAKASPLRKEAARAPLPKYFAVREQTLAGPGTAPMPERVAAILGALNETGYWEAPLGMISHPYRGPGSATVAPGDFSQTHVGDETDTSPYRDDRVAGITTAVYLRNMSLLIRYLDQAR